MTATDLRFGLPALPPRLAALPIDDRGFPVPWFVAWVDGKPDHRVMDGEKLGRAVREHRCWMCGEEMLGVHKTFCIGPMCAITRTIAEPPSHIECLRYAVRACPFLTRPHAHRRDAGLPEDARDGAGLPIKRNPGVVCLWTTKRFEVRRNGADDHGNPGLLFGLGEPESIEWWAEGRTATRAEIDDSVRSGYPLLEAEALEEDRHVQARPLVRFMRGPRESALADLMRRVGDLQRLLERFPPAAA